MMELGLGVHGEAGVASVALQTAQEAVAAMLRHMTDPGSASALVLSKQGERLAVIVNNLGGTSKLEELVGSSPASCSYSCSSDCSQGGDQPAGGPGSLRG